MIAQPESKEWSNQQNFEAAKKFKEEGNKYFEMKEYKQALKAYHKAFLHLGGIIDSGSAMSAYSKKVATSQLTEQVNQLRFSISLNMAQIYIFQQKYDRGLDMYVQRDLDQLKQAKQKLIRGICLMRLSEFQKAKEDLSKVVDLDSSMRVEIQKLNDQMKSLQKRQEQKSKDMFKKFFK